MKYYFLGLAFDLFSIIHSTPNTSLFKTEVEVGRITLLRFNYYAVLCHMCS